MEQAGLASEFEYCGEVDRPGKIAFLQTVDVMSVPATYDEPKGMFLLEAMALGIPVVQPRRGAFPEIIEKTGGGVLVDPGDPDALAATLEQLQNDPGRRAALGAAGAAGVRAHYSVGQMGETVEQIYQRVLRPPQVAAV
jgi:glycosyltransferase involved in cell wall biosynthesis